MSFTFFVVVTKFLLLLLSVRFTLISSLKPDAKISSEVPDVN